MALDASVGACESRGVKSCVPSGSQDLALVAEQERRPPPFLGVHPYHGLLPATGRNSRQRFLACFRASAPLRFATGCNGLRPLGSIKAPSSVVQPGYVLRDAGPLRDWVLCRSGRSSAACGVEHAVALAQRYCDCPLRVPLLSGSLACRVAPWRERRAMMSVLVDLARKPLRRPLVLSDLHTGPGCREAPALRGASN